ncbi:MAG: TspO/MBR family protein [Arenimonas sp.]
MVRSWPRLAVCVGITAAGAVLGGLASRDAASFYASLQLPAWAPPGNVFGPVWSVLYLMMAIAFYRIQVAGPPQGRTAPTALFVVQLAANALWSWLFFAWHRGASAMLDISVLWILIIATIMAFRRRDALAAWLMVPYLGWVCFAAALNFAVWRLNPAALAG